MTEQFYHWIQTTLRVEWDIHNKRLVILFIDVPVRQREYLKRNLPTKRKEQLHPFVWHALFAESVIDLYDKSIWKVRDLVRAIEKVYPPLRKSDGGRMHVLTGDRNGR